MNGVKQVSIYHVVPEVS